MDDKEVLTSFFREKLLQILPDYEERKEQLTMAFLVNESLNRSQNLLIEAGTGVGKSLAYLLPLIFHSQKEGKKVVISTYTKILQEQLRKKDIPIAQEIIPFSFACAYGSDNYLCRRRMEKNLRLGLFEPEEEKEFREKVSFWAREKKGLVVDFPENIPPSLLAKIARDGESCLGKKCGFYDGCYYFRAKREWEEAEVLIINHFLFFAHCTTDYQLLPEFDTIIFDEGHRLEDAAVSYLGIDLSNTSLQRSLTLLYNPRTKKGFLLNLPIAFSQKERLKKKVVEVKDSLDGFFSEINEKVEPRKRILRPLALRTDFVSELASLNASLLEVWQELKDEELRIELRGMIKSLKKKEKEIKDFINLSDSDSVYWMEREEGRTYLKSAHLSVAGIIKEILSNFKVYILTSATLTVANDFTFITNRLGIESAITKILASPFDYSKQSLLFIDERLPFPSEEEEFIKRCASVIEELIKIARGRTLILFTSFKMMEETFARCQKGRFPFLKQGDKPSYTLLKEFQEDTASCLFATASFWQGVDVPGETLSSLIITRLPFDVPDEPRIEGIVEDLKRKGIEPFWNFQLPQAILRFRQGFGRLIRNKNDRGVVSVLDKRLIKRNYG
ncbi:MAG: ATP-dependent DNA helicase, partial [candidate division WOR-3 bacterium]